MMFGAVLFAELVWLWITPMLLGACAALFLWSSRKRLRQLNNFADAGVLASLLASHSRWRRRFKLGLILFSFAAIGIALARPQWGQVPEAMTQHGEDVVFLVDTSKSMLAADVKPNRLERAKVAIREFVARYAGGRVGLVAFAGDAFLMCPLTLDVDAFDEAVGELATDSVLVPGSNLAAALFAGKNAFEESERRKLLVLITDGEDLDQLGVSAAKKLAEENVVVFTIGVGTANGAAVMVPQPDGQLTPLLDSNDRPVTSRLDEKTLEEIAVATGGSYRRLESVAASMADIARTLRESEAKPTIAQMKQRGIDRYQWPLAVAICLLVVESLLHTRRRLRPAQS